MQMHDHNQVFANKPARISAKTVRRLAHWQPSTFLITSHTAWARSHCPIIHHVPQPGASSCQSVYLDSYELLPPASACDAEPLPPSATLLVVIDMLLLFVAIALCHSGIFTLAAGIPLLNGELRPVLETFAWKDDPPFGVSLAVTGPFAVPFAPVSLPDAGAVAVAGEATGVGAAADGRLR